MQREPLCPGPRRKPPAFSWFRSRSPPHPSFDNNRGLAADSKTCTRNIEREASARAPAAFLKPFSPPNRSQTPIQWDILLAGGPEQRLEPAGCGYSRAERQDADGFQPPDLLSPALSLPLTFHSNNMAAHWGLGWRGASWDMLWPRLRRWRRHVRSRQAALEQVAWLPCQPEACVNLGNSQATRTQLTRVPACQASAQPRIEGKVPGARTGARHTELGTRGQDRDDPLSELRESRHGTSCSRALPFTSGLQQAAT